MLDVDALRELVGEATHRSSDPAATLLLAEIARRLDVIHRDLAHIPEDIIPPF